MTLGQLTISEQINISYQLSSQTRRNGEVHMVNLQSGLLYLSMSQKNGLIHLHPCCKTCLPGLFACRNLTSTQRALILHEVRCAMSQPHDRGQGELEDHFHGAHSYICHTTSETMKIEKTLMLKCWQFHRILTRWNSFDKVDINI